MIRPMVLVRWHSRGEKAIASRVTPHPTRMITRVASWRTSSLHEWQGRFLCSRRSTYLANEVLSSSKKHDLNPSKAPDCSGVRGWERSRPSQARRRETGGGGGGDLNYWHFQSSSTRAMPLHNKLLRMMMMTMMMMMLMDGWVPAPTGSRI
jgi:hypothetical protein